jgi:YD repeat-containing protein
MYILKIKKIFNLLNQLLRDKKQPYMFVFLLSFFSAEVVVAQYQPFQAIKSPNVASMERFGDIPVNLFTGIPDISVPLYNLSSGNISIPIALRYHSSLVKPNQPSSWVGLGWDLSFGGAISRQVRGYYDETYFGATSAFNIINYLNGGATSVESDNTWYDSNKMYGEYYKISGFSEQQADEFNFNFLGHSGKFYFSGATKSWVVVSDEKIKIEVRGFMTPSEIIKDALFKYKTFDPRWYYDGRIDYIQMNQTSFFKEFTLITPDGTRYTFGGIEGVEFTTNFTDSKTQSTPYEGINVTSWLLKSIVDTNGRTVNFNYKKEYPYVSLSHYCNSYTTSQADQSWSGSWGLGGYSGSKGSSSSSFSQLINPYRLAGNFVFPMYLTSIESDMETVSFTSSPATTLNYTEAQISSGSHHWDNSDEYNIWIPNLKWNKLTNIDIKPKIGNTTSLKSCSFEYFEASNQRFSLSKLKILGSDANVFQKYEFQYDDIASLPLFGGNYTDHWGFFNNINIRSTLNTAFQDRQTDPNYVTKGLLSQIKYPTGGMSKLYWEAHTHNKVLSTSKDQLSDYVGYAGGSRIKSIDNYTDVGVLASQKKYLYVRGYTSALNPSTLASSGVLNGIPSYSFSFSNYKGKNGVTTFSFDTFSLNSFTNSNPTGNGSHIGYDEVVELNMDKSYTKHYFTNYGADINGELHYDKAPVGTTGWKIGENSVYMAFSSLENERGKEIGTYDYNSQDNLVQKKKYIFRNDAARFDQFVKQKIVSSDYTSDTSGDALMFAVAIKNFSYSYYPISQEITNYDLKGQNPIVNTKYFTYNSNNQLSEETLVNSNNKSITSKYYYPQDFSSEPYMQNLITTNRIKTPISIEKYNTNLLSKEKTIFIVDATTSNLVLPKSVYSAKFPNNIPFTTNVGNLEKKLTYDLYDTSGNLTQYTPEGGAPVSIVWGYNKTQPIAKIENVTNAQLISALGVSDFSAITEAQLASLNNLRTNSSFTSSMITTYTYQPLVGVSSITDPKGDTVYYTYDGLGRLQYVKDAQGKLLTDYQYHYKN